ncbi:DUF3325 domain-containing protein [Pseudomonas sp. 5P_3.1_Bac2]|uniref:DUF3325 domain-containing protein n=1 Tax=Pseudomonas sp. 5P_3.1_Bac2 TaxID=2971617 RepID=UPI0021CA613B|nr:DUF3325 domain-containing protein [Pseudomonas sp. 5P_3.1_Bac2]MCU1718107.1 DUF3325 domain-containing protein [Pseudomonas sp. 5P_3.1_Bac2]
MANLLLHLLALAFAIIGMGWLALSLDVHWRQVLACKDPLSAGKSRAMRVLGYICLILSGVMCCLTDRPSIAVLVWFMLQAVSAVLITLLLAWRAQWLRLLLIWTKTGH